MENNEIYYKLYTSGGQFIDLSDFLHYTIAKHIILLGPKQSGKSVLCSMIRCYFDENLSCAELFGKEQVEKFDSLVAFHLNQHPIINLDFSDFNEKTYEDALCYLRRKMADLYYHFRDILIDTEKADSSNEFDVDVMTENVEEKELCYSLMHLLSRFYRYKNRYEKEEKPILILENFNRLKLVAAYFGYREEMADFVKKMTNFDFYDYTFLMLETGYEPAGMHLLGESYYGHEESVYSFSCLRKVCELNHLPLGEQRNDKFLDYAKKRLYCGGDVSHAFDDLHISDERISENFHPIDEIRKEYLQKRKLEVALSKEAKRKEEIERKKREKKRYQQGLSEFVHIPSQNAGIREFSLPQDSKSYQEREKFLRELFIEFGKSDSMLKIYRRMHNVDSSVHTDWSKENFESLQKITAQNAYRWKWVRLDGDDNFWDYVKVGALHKENEIHNCEMIKVYVSIDDDVHVATIFIDAITSLLSCGINSFYAKVSKYKRNDVMCFWLSKHDYHVLSDCLSTYQTELRQKLPFIAYHNNLGIGREMASWDSQSAIQAELITTYFSLVQKPEDISLSEMYHLFVKGWNNDLDAEHPMTKKYKETNAQILLVLLDSIDVITGKTVMDDKHLLLQDDRAIWEALCDGENWAAVGERYLQEIEKM